MDIFYEFSGTLDSEIIADGMIRVFGCGKKENTLTLDLRVKNRAGRPVSYLPRFVDRNNPEFRFFVIRKTPGVPT